jgi:hypothetical protein
MFKPTVFVSCGQRTAEEKMLGIQICAMVTELTPFKPFFADTQNNLNGLHDNIMSALAKAVGFIAVMHPRGNVFVPGETEPLITRASVWVEQEIAIAAYIDRLRPQRLLTAVYQHRSVGREGMRELLHLNPMGFDSHESLLRDLRSRIADWRLNESIDDGGELSLKANPAYSPGGRRVTLIPHFRNLGERADKYSCVMYVPSQLMMNMGSNYLAVASDRQGYDKFVFSEKHRNGEPILHDTSMDFMSIEASLTEVPASLRPSLGPIVVTADIGARRYKTEIAVAEAFPTRTLFGSSEQP